MPQGFTSLSHLFLSTLLERVFTFIMQIHQGSKLRVRSRFPWQVTNNKPRYEISFLFRVGWE